jgi:hypothetical protein
MYILEITTPSGQFDEMLATNPTYKKHVGPGQGVIF